MKNKLHYFTKNKVQANLITKEGCNSNESNHTPISKPKNGNVKKIQILSYDEKYSSAVQKTNYTNGSKNNNINISSPEEFSNHDEKCHILQKTVDKNKSNMIGTKKLDYITIQSDQADITTNEGSTNSKCNKEGKFSQITTNKTNNTKSSPNLSSPSHHSPISMLPKVNFNKIQTRYNNEECFSAKHSTSSSRNRDSNEDPQLAIERTNNNKKISDYKNNNPMEIKTQSKKRNARGGIKLKQDERNHNMFNNDTFLSRNESINKYSQKESSFLQSPHKNILQHTEISEDKVVTIIPNNKCCHLTTAKEIRNLYPTKDTDMYSSVFSYLTSTPETSVDEVISQHSKCKLQIKKVQTVNASQ